MTMMPTVTTMLLLHQRLPVTTVTTLAHRPRLDLRRDRRRGCSFANSCPLKKRKNR
jgi:hypothetical protein